MGDEVAAVHAMAGALGGLLGLGVFYPLDVLRSLVQLNDPRVRNLPTLQALLKLWQQGGVLWQGVKVRFSPIHRAAAAKKSDAVHRRWWEPMLSHGGANRYTCPSSLLAGLSQFIHVNTCHPIVCHHHTPSPCKLQFSLPTSSFSSHVSRAPHQASAFTQGVSNFVYFYCYKALSFKAAQLLGVERLGCDPTRTRTVPVSLVSLVYPPPPLSLFLSLSSSSPLLLLLLLSRSCSMLSLLHYSHVVTPSLSLSLSPLPPPHPLARITPPPPMPLPHSKDTPKLCSIF
jgi:hypothetical protein